MTDELKQYSLSKELAQSIQHFLQHHNPDRMSRNLRKVFFDYIRHQADGLDVEFDAILDDIEALMDFLDICSDETKAWKN